LLGNGNAERAAHELYAIGVRTRGAIRMRGSAARAAPARFPKGTDTCRILEMFKDRADPRLRIAVADALGEMGGAEVVPVLEQLATGDARDKNAGARAAYLDALGKIGGPRALAAMERAADGDPDHMIRNVAQGWMDLFRGEERVAYK
jgi:hypothetical protein